ncbi:GroES-like protein [Gonapodya prolifera JEL478]|uniref:GroES-like protein n=1 Tax=Gonapodya prolifera (strain JEL478) TaxID=1344416 RepID=A0A139AUI2_GONPJ|nr:GroES-like protein [Gonapodya prolifera JEL478]|eukprot:KXS20391.1 GroES-like protein [Gonapodya prolifera JEL478]
MTVDTYSAVVLRGIKELRLEQQEKPVLGEGEALIRMKACGICGSDLHFWKGEMPVPFPCPMGHEGSGVVEELGGGDVNGIAVGDRVAIMPSSLETMNMLGRYSKQPAKLLYKIPDHVSFEEAAYVEPLAVSLHAVKRGGIAPSSPATVFIIGAGPIGQNSLLCAKVEGASWVGVMDIREDRLEAAKKLGADAVVQPAPASAQPEKPAVDSGDVIKATVARALALLPEGKQVDVVVDAVGSSDTLNTAISLVKPFGVVVNVGIGHFKANVDMLTAAYKQIDIRPAFAYPTEFPEALELIASGRVDVKPLLTHTLPLEEFEKGYNTALESKAGSVKVMFQI